MNIHKVVVTYSNNGQKLAEKLEEKFEIVNLAEIPERSIAKESQYLQPFLAANQLVLMIMDLAVAVQLIAPVLTNLATAPGVIVIDEAGKYVIDLLPGVQAGTKQFVIKMAAILGATPVTPNTSDIIPILKLDQIALEHNLLIDSPEIIPRFNDKVEAGTSIVIWEQWYTGIQWPGNVRIETGEALQLNPEEKILLIIGYQTPSFLLPSDVLMIALRPACITVGLAGYNNQPAYRLSGAIRRYFREQNWSVKSIKALVTLGETENDPILTQVSQEFGVSVTPVNQNSLNQSGKAITTLPDIDQTRHLVEQAVLRVVKNGHLIGSSEQYGSLELAAVVGFDSK